MGYIPPTPPIAIFGEAGSEWIETTCLSDTEASFVPGTARPYLRMPKEESPQSRMARLAELERITKREAAIGAVLFLMLPVALLACILQWVGVL